MRRANGFSLIELMMALMILGLVAVCAHDVLSAGALRLKKIQELGEREAESATALALMKKDLRCAFLSTEPADTLFVGRRESESKHARLDFVRTGQSKDSIDDFWKVGYALEHNSRNGQWELWRYAQERKILLCGGVAAFDVTYFDGEAWQASWGWNEAASRPFSGIRGLPVAVSIRLAFQDGTESTTVAPVMTSLLNATAHE